MILSFKTYLSFLVFLFAFQMHPAQAQKKFQREINFDEDWRFTRGSVAGAEQINFDDSKWRELDLPHDWSIEDIPNQIPGKTVGPFSKDSPGATATGYTIGGTGWYRKNFVLNENASNKKISIYFEGAYMETDVWINGMHVGEHKNGYTSFYFDITKYCKPAGQNNVIAVCITSLGKNSRWYSGSGIYRHVKLIETNLIHIAQWGVYITTPNASQKDATIIIQTKILNETNKSVDVKVQTNILNVENKIVAQSNSYQPIEANNDATALQNIYIKSPKLWSVNSPNQYHAAVSLFINGKFTDKTITSFGIRTISISAGHGLLLNGKVIKLHGGCVHHDNGILGSAAIDRAEIRKVELLKANGFNAIRCSHNPPSEKFLEACDKSGMLVVDELFDQWEKAKNPDDYHLFFDAWWEKDFSDFILRDRNHPSVILWSVGNEIEERAEPSGLKIVKEFKSVLKKLDPSRMITEAVNDPWDHPGNKWSYTAPAFSLLDVGGYNYQWWEYENDHKIFPERIMMGTESVAQEAKQNWDLIEKHPYIIGDFVWTAMDYLGESGIGHRACEIKGEKDPQLKPWPWFNANCGDIDLIGDKKPQSYYQDVIWRRTKITMAVHVPLPDGCKEQVSYWGWPNETRSWTWPGYEGKLMHVNVYSRSAKVRMVLNGKIIAEKKTDSLFTAKFELPYTSGELKAIALDGDKKVGQFSLYTTGKALRIQLVPDKGKIQANRNDLCYVKVLVIDKKGHVVPNADILVQFKATGSGELAAAGNANPAQMESFRQPEHYTFRGKCLVVLRSNGKVGNITLEARSPGLERAKITIKAQ